MAAHFAWFQGHKDSGAEESIAEYERHLVNLIKDVRKEFKMPKMPAVVATVGFGGHNMADKFLRILTYSAGMENWFAPDFDAAKAGWRKGL